MVKQQKGSPAIAGSSAREISAFLGKARQLQTRPSDNRLIFALDATASRQATWDRACHLQAKMFEATRQLSGLNIQLCYYRGLDEFRALPWSSNGPALQQQMLSVTCLGGHSQIERLLQHTLSQHRQGNIRALVFVGDAMEENCQRLYQLAGQMGIHRLPAFMFQEGFDTHAAQAFAHIAHLSSGAHCQFDDRSENQLRELLTAVAVYAAGGIDAVKRLEQPSTLVQQLLKTLPEG